jgi:hypothetical protein
VAEQAFQQPTMATLAATAGADRFATTGWFGGAATIAGIAATIAAIAATIATVAGVAAGVRGTASGLAAAMASMSEQAVQ